jgi:hypothetical protein
MLLLTARLWLCDQSVNKVCQSNKVDVREFERLLHGAAAESNGLRGGELIRHETAVFPAFSDILCWATVSFDDGCRRLYVRRDLKAILSAFAAVLGRDTFPPFRADE